MKRNKTVSFIRKMTLMSFLTLSLQLVAQIPAGYYDSANGLTGATLKSALHNIIDGHTEYPYSSSGTDVWDILKVADRDPNNSSNVIGLYSNFSMNAAAEYDGGAGWNREHVWAKSRGNFGTSKGAGTDLHHVRAADVSTNSARNNRNFDEASTQYIDGSGNYSGTTDSYTSSTDWIWEPRDEVKGDVARMIFYMTVRYEGTNGEPDLEITDNLLSSTDQSPYHGKASVLVQWHLDDPVSSEEIARNNVVYSYQNNRNPFIDHPEYVCMIYGSYCSGGGSGSGGNDLFISEYIEGSSYNKGLELANTTGTSVNLSDYSLKKQTNGAGSWGSTYNLSGSLANGQVFTIVHSSANSSMKNVADVETSSGIVTFNGNDPIGLFKNGTLIDIIGVFNGGSSNFAANTTLVRKSTVTAPNTTYTGSEWDNYASDTFSYFGSHSGSGGSSTGTDLYLSEYIEGSSYNKGLEISNKTGSQVDLSDYSLKKQTNGSGSWGSTYNLSGTLNDNSVFVIVHSSASSSMQSVADVQTSSGIVTFNGNDPIGLFKNGTLIDIIGTFNGGSSYFAKDKTLVRKLTVVDPNSSYTVSEWNEYSSDTFGFLGDNSSARLKPSLYTESNNALIYPNPVSGVLTITVKNNPSGVIQLIDLQGKIVFESIINSSTIQIATEELPKGVYLARILSNKEIENHRVVIE